MRMPPHGVAFPVLTLLLIAVQTHAAQLHQVVIVFKTHFDIGYTDMASNVVQRYRTTMVDDALKVVEENRSLPAEQQFVWTIPGWPASQILEKWPGQLPQRQGLLDRAFREGRFVVHALPFSMHTELLEPEDLVRALGYSSRVSRGLALELPKDAKMTDVPCHSWILPTLLRRAGVDFLHLGCNAASSSPRVPFLYWWEGPDGSRLLTMYSAGGYGTGLLPPPDWPHSTWLALIQTGDNHGPPRPEEVGQLLKEAKEKLPEVQVHIGRLSDFAEALLAEHPELPVVRGDMPDTWIHGPMSDPQGARLARNTRLAMGTAESLHSEMAAWGVAVSNLVAELATAREQSLLYGEHTWGGALYWVTGYGKDLKWGYGDQWKRERETGRFKRLEASWAEHSSYIERAGRLTASVLADELTALAQAVNLPGQRIVVFNPLPWKRDGLVVVRGVAGNGDLKPADGSATLPTWTNGDQLCFVAQGVPASGYRTYQLVPSRPYKPRMRVDAQSRVVESPFFRAILDPAHGRIASLLDKRAGRELVDGSSTQGFGQYLYERFDSNNVAAYVKAYVKIQTDWAAAELGKPNLPPARETSYQAASPTECILSLTQSAGAVTAMLRSSPTARLPSVVTLRLTLYAELPCVDLEIRLEEKPADPWPEAGWLCLPFRMNAAQFRLGRLGSIVNPATDIVAGANHDLEAIHTGVALLDEKGYGVGICPLDSPLVSLERPGCWRYSPDFIPRKPSLFINLFNNQWTTNFRLWNSGTWSSRVRLWSFGHYDPETALITPSLEARQPLLGAVANGPAGMLPLSCNGLGLSHQGVAVTAFGPNPDGAGLVLRLWEYAGKPVECIVHLPQNLKATRAQPVDLRGRAISPVVPIRNGAFTARLERFAPSSFVLEE